MFFTAPGLNKWFKNSRFAAATHFDSSRTPSSSFVGSRGTWWPPISRNRSWPRRRCHWFESLCKVSSEATSRSSSITINCSAAAGSCWGCYRESSRLLHPVLILIEVLFPEVIFSSSVAPSIGVRCWRKMWRWLANLLWNLLQSRFYKILDYETQ